MMVTRDSSTHLSHGFESGGSSDKFVAPLAFVGLAVVHFLVRVRVEEAHLYL